MYSCDLNPVFIPQNLVPEVLGYKTFLIEKIKKKIYAAGFIITA